MSTTFLSDALRSVPPVSIPSFVDFVEAIYKEVDSIHLVYNAFLCAIGTVIVIWLAVRLARLNRMFLAYLRAVLLTPLRTRVLATDSYLDFDSYRFERGLIRDEDIHNGANPLFARLSYKLSVTYHFAPFLLGASKELLVPSRKST